jgi:hypothetical protein
LPHASRHDFAEVPHQREIHVVELGADSGRVELGRRLARRLREIVGVLGVERPEQDPKCGARIAYLHEVLD